MQDNNRTAVLNTIILIIITCCFLTIDSVSGNTFSYAGRRYKVLPISKITSKANAEAMCKAEFHTGSRLARADLGIYQLNYVSFRYHSNIFACLTTFQLGQLKNKIIK